ncbi:unnamed protein product [Didymodactylos carnosus]|uniref:Ca3427-like PBP 2 domain-containing protein n=1 Tax=Didymodactylos carnosus TaxID=1234261 RepID=A0A815BPS0_9BILA|nr:unnamed protein product [Didymodactylos carnosus]CAF1276457.1 unnamed protein product [Didymodactylos carnosus]CAF3580394.1 unnamed protein product [Didymodactylos carnosus]CAF4068344.1 unnamed protein product [Didymodactylos carnosus]
MTAEPEKQTGLSSPLTTLRIGGVPEHFNEPWHIGIEQKLFENEGIRLEWVSIKEGTGALINKLKENEVDAVVALTEGLLADIVNGSSLRLLGTYVESPLCWAISTGAQSEFHHIEDLKGQTMGISRFNSGSHLMCCVLASQRGWKQSDINYKVNNNFETLRASVNDGSTAAFMWETFMQKPYFDKGEIRRIGEITTPWPCFMIASTTTTINNHLQSFKAMFKALESACEIFKKNVDNTIVQTITNKFHLTTEDALAWHGQVEIVGRNQIDESCIETTIDALKAASIVDNNYQVDPAAFIDIRLTNLTIDIKSMRLYNKPELLTVLYNNLRFDGLAKGTINYKQLLQFDQNHYHGTEVLDLAVNKCQLNSASNNRVIQIGSSVGGCSRYLAGQYNLTVLAIELQHELHATACELTERCLLNDSVHHMCGNFLTVANHLQGNNHNAIVSWITILHFTRTERNKLFKQCYDLLKTNGYFYCEDFIRLGNLTQEEKQILKHDVYCRYIPTAEEYAQQLNENGFSVVETESLTDDWTLVTKQRLEQFEATMDHQLQVHGKEIYERLKFFYEKIVELFQGGHVGGIRIVAQKCAKN